MFFSTNQRFFGFSIGFLVFLRILNQLNINYNRESQKTRPFYTQKDLVRGLTDKNGDPKKPEFCHPLASLWLKYQIENKGREYLNDENITAALLIDTLTAQRAMRLAGEDFVNDAFVATKTPYIVKTIDTSILQNSEGVKHTLNKHRFAFLQFPVNPMYSLENKKGMQHAIAFSDDKKGNCRFFDADYPGGDKQGNCPEIYAAMATRLRLFADPEQGETTVTLDSQYTTKHP